jgi:hypothetical protein
MGPKQRKAFKALERLASKAPAIAFFVPGWEMKVETDASRNATGNLAETA